MFKKIMIGAAVTSGVLTAGFLGAYALFPASWLSALAITAGTCFYHFAMRLAVGYAWNLRQTHDPNAAWFREKPFEKALYKRLQVKRWKHRVPTYDPSAFDVSTHPLEEIAQAMCHSELVHETIIVLSFLPLFAAVPFGEFWVFLATSVVAAAVDTMFVILQRYNRPRVMTLIRRQKRASLV